MSASPHQPHPTAALPTVLAFDTSTETLLVALVRDGAAYLHEGPGGARSSADLLPAALQLLRQAGVSHTRLDAVAFGRGPGAFTGLRTACAVAQGLALGLGRPTMPVDTLMIVAEAARQAHPSLREVWAILDARMQQVYAAHYRLDAEANWQVQVPPGLWDPRDLPVAPDVAVAGNALALVAERGDGALVSRWIEAVPTAAALAQLARQAWYQGVRVDPAQALPLYVRDKVAYTTAEREAMRQTASLS